MAAGTWGIKEQICKASPAFVPLWLIISGIILISASVVSGIFLIYILVEPHFVTDNKNTARVVVSVQICQIGIMIGWIVMGIVNLTYSCYQNYVLWKIALASVLVLFASLLRSLGTLIYSLS